MPEIIIVFSILAATAIGFVAFRGFSLRTVNRITAPLAEDFPETGFSHKIFQLLLSRFVDQGGRVNYDAWQDDKNAKKQLAQYIAAVQCYSPENTPDRFPLPTQRLAYWINAYNALVICSVLKHWPLASVTDVKSPIEIKKGMGFFYLQRHIVGGATLSLYELEHKRLIGNGADPRVHFLLNCASTSCPVLRSVTGDGPEMERFLQEAAAEFVGDPNQVQINHAEKSVTLSRIFKWYMADFTAALRDTESTDEQCLLNFIASVAPPDMAIELKKCLNYRIGFLPFDWTINAPVKAEV